MKTNSPKYDEHIKNALYEHRQQQNQPRHGIIQSYDSSTNTATVLMSAPDGDVAGDILTNVICPVNMGVQTVAPSSGRPCWVAFKQGQNDKKAIIVSYFNHKYHDYDYGRENFARSSIPRYMMSM